MTRPGWRGSVARGSLSWMPLEVPEKRLPGPAWWTLGNRQVSESGLASFGCRNEQRIR